MPSDRAGGTATTENGKAYLLLPHFSCAWKEHGCETVAFPLISSGIYGYPKDQALKVAIDTISDFLLENDMTVYIVIFDRKAYQISEKLFSDIAAYIDDTYVDAHTDSRASQLRRMQMLSEEAICGAPMAASAKSLDDALSQIDESFSEMLLRKIDEKGDRRAVL